jgi:hypothetical protein
LRNEIYKGIACSPIVVLASELGILDSPQGMKSFVIADLLKFEGTGPVRNG